MVVVILIICRSGKSKELERNFHKWFVGWAAEAVCSLEVTGAPTS